MSLILKVLNCKLLRIFRQKQLSKPGNIDTVWILNAGYDEIPNNTKYLIQVKEEKEGYVNVNSSAHDSFDPLEIQELKLFFKKTELKHLPVKNTIWHKKPENPFDKIIEYTVKMLKQHSLVLESPTGEEKEESLYNFIKNYTNN